MYASQSPFGGVVVEEDERIQSYIQALGDGIYIGSLVLPIRHEAGDVAETEDHVGMGPENRSRGL